MSQTSAARAAETILPPVRVGVTVSGMNTAVNSNNATTTAWRSALTAPTGSKKYYLTVAALTQNVFVAFKNNTATATVSSTSGWPIPAGTQQSFWINPNEISDMEYVAAANTAVVYWYVSSPGYEGA